MSAIRRKLADLIKSRNKKILHVNLSSPLKNEASINWGIVGTGHMAHTFGRAIDKVEGNTVSLICSRSAKNAKSFASKFQRCHFTDNLTDYLMNSDSVPDIIYIATPVETHEEIIVKCIKRGVHVLCEKPIVLSTEVLKNIAGLAGKAYVLEAMWLNFMPTLKKAQDLISKGEIGEVLTIKVDFFKNRVRSKDIWLDFGPYVVAFVQYFTSGNTKVCASKSIGTHTTYTNLESDGITSFVCVSSQFSGSSAASIYGTKGRIEWSTPFNRASSITVYDEHNTVIKRYNWKFHSDGYEYQVYSINNIISGGDRTEYLERLNNSINRIELINDIIKMR